MQRPVEYPNVSVGRDHIDIVRGNRHAIHDLMHRHGREFCHEFRQHTPMGRVKVLDQDESHATVVGHPGEETFKGFQATR